MARDFVSMRVHRKVGMAKANKIHVLEVGLMKGRR
jgi:hypothetical protein